ncbi:MAG: hypothetical protein HY455_01305 [Parcubacteria group bacterium]|nr:hypothetical protein [Parcubacteria group bacterium]
MLANFLNLLIRFVADNIAVPFVFSFFTVVGGATPIATLIYIFSKKEKRLLNAHADEVERSLPLLEKLLEKMVQLVEKSITPQTLGEGADNFRKVVEAQNMIEENKKFIKYARKYNFISAVGHVLRVGNYIPKGISEHKEISKNLPGS